METDTNTAALLSAIEVSVRRGKRQLLQEVSLQVNAGEVVGLIGPNGAGKSTLLRVLAGLEQIQAGRVLLDGQALSAYTDNERAQQLGWMDQQAGAHWPVSVEHVVSLGRMPYLNTWQPMSDADHVQVEKALSDTDCLALRHQRVTTLSGGELTRVMLARVLASEPQVLLADEPTAALDIGHQLQTMELLRSFTDSTRGCLVVLHDLSLAARYCDRLYLLDNGCCAAGGTSSEVLSAENIREVYGVDVDISNGNIPYILPLRRSGA